MRRVLFGTGYPQAAPSVAFPLVNPDDCLQILDLRDLNAEGQSYTRFVTLFAKQMAAGFGLARVYVQVGDDTPYLVGQMTAIAAVSSTATTSLRYQLRGNARMFVTSPSSVVAVLGYYELESETPTIQVDRPLQPADPVSPFTVVPVSVPASTSIPVHAFEEDYTDQVTIDFALSTGEALGDATIDFPNGVSLLLPITAASQYNLMSGIPMMADGDGQEIVATASATTTFLVVSGTFSRS